VALGRGARRPAVVTEPSWKRPRDPWFRSFRFVRVVGISGGGRGSNSLAPLGFRRRVISKVRSEGEQQEEQRGEREATISHLEVACTPPAVKEFVWTASEPRRECLETAQLGLSDGRCDKTG
jgi:hypothetical protein